MNVCVVVRFEVMIMVVLKTPVFWDVSVCKMIGSMVDKYLFLKVKAF